MVDHTPRFAGSERDSIQMIKTAVIHANPALVLGCTVRSQQYDNSVEFLIRASTVLKLNGGHTGGEIGSQRPSHQSAVLHTVLDNRAANTRTLKGDGLPNRQILCPNAGAGRNDDRVAIPCCSQCCRYVGLGA